MNQYETVQGVFEAGTDLQLSLLCLLLAACQPDTLASQGSQQTSEPVHNEPSCQNFLLRLSGPQDNGAVKWLPSAGPAMQHNATSSSHDVLFSRNPADRLE